MTSLTQEQIQKLVEEDAKRRAYRAEYNKRPEVKARRKAYMTERRHEQQAIYRAFKEGRLTFGGTRVNMGTGEVEE